MMFKLHLTAYPGRGVSRLLSRKLFIMTKKYPLAFSFLIRYFPPAGTSGTSTGPLQNCFEKCVYCAKEKYSSFPYIKSNSNLTY